MPWFCRVLYHKHHLSLHPSPNNSCLHRFAGWNLYSVPFTNLISLTLQCQQCWYNIEFASFLLLYNFFYVDIEDFAMSIVDTILIIYIYLPSFNQFLCVVDVADIGMLIVLTWYQVDIVYTVKLSLHQEIQDQSKHLISFDLTWSTIEPITQNKDTRRRSCSPLRCCCLNDEKKQDIGSYHLIVNPMSSNIAEPTMYLIYVG